ncbi:acetyl/propionyl/methylcrotonyl-CoA carboxylase subunit alpha [Nocardioides sp.]|uniref:acetyl/propionyl/methylcrotonyl-CoA carboxylase subunit alpha n=1 Tax=Nocardioides sp. TaxID=35761 RepID=UPI003782E81F
MHTLLIANRGEIALRVMRTARRMGIRTVAIFTDADVTAPHVRAADEARRVESYLDVEAVVAAAQAAGADAVHPGYGFLSERSAFARAVEAAGITLVGPTAEVMDAMGRKDAAREIAVAAGVPVVPTGDDASFPVLVKAAAGGGGKGMRIVRDESELEEARAAAAREARSAFGDDTILVEKYVERGRHIEVQVMADAHGNVVHLFERDCSTQRRHQKVLEEAPAPTITPEVRELVTSSAVALAAHVGYRNAGTVEFLLDPDANGGTGEAYFLEMNTRLQVEHPVTEAITGYDLVELQLRVADGEPLPITQDDVTVTGHAIEARVYAEDSFGGFLPQAGRTSIVRWPDGVRVDHALEPEQVVSTSYDPMLGKVIVHGATREDARRALVDALDRTAILGLTTNTGFLRALVAGDEFRDATIDTAWLDRHEVAPPDAGLPRVLVAWVSAMLAAAGDAHHPFQSDGWRSGADPAPTIVELDRPVVVDRYAGRVDDLAVRQVSAANHVLTLEVAGELVSAVVNVQPHVAEVAHHGQRFVFERPDVFGDHAVDVSDGAIVAPMPGTVLDVRVADGDRVEAGQVLVVVEAMKMELALKAPFDGTVARVAATTGAQVALGHPLLEVQPHD